MSGLRIVRGWKALSDDVRGASVAMGNFDGVHRGHLKVISLAATAAAALKAPLGVVTFDPHPNAYFHPGGPAFRLMKLDQQVRVLEGLGVDLLYILPLDVELAKMGGQAFASQVLSRGLDARHVAIGFDNSFGRDRADHPLDLVAYGQDLGFSVSIAEPVLDAAGVKFSSTAVREAMRDGRPDAARAILGRPFAIEGVVRQGRQLGRTLGFPTANVDLDDYVQPKFGVYATRTRLPDGREIPGVANIGVNPTVGETVPRLEVWLFDFDEDLYGQVIETDLIAFLRPEAVFDSLETMTVQVMADAKAARDLLMPDFG